MELIGGRWVRGIKRQVCALWVWRLVGYMSYGSGVCACSMGQGVPSPSLSTRSSQQSRLGRLVPRVGVVLVGLAVVVVVVDVHDDVLQQGPSVQVLDQVQEQRAGARHGLAGF